MNLSDRSIYLTYHDTPKVISQDSQSEYTVSLTILANHIRLVKMRNDFFEYERIVLTFDDGNYSNLETAKCLTENGLKGIFFITTERINSVGYLSSDDLRSIHRMGHIIGSHSASHPMFPFISKKQAEIELSKSKEFIEEISGAECTAFAFPGGQFLPQHINLAKNVGYGNIFTSIEGVGKNKNFFYRMHVTQSVCPDFEKIIDVDSRYYIYRRVRSYLSLFKNVYSKPFKLFLS